MLDILWASLVGAASLCMGGVHALRSLHLPHWRKTWREKIERAGEILKVGGENVTFECVSRGPLKLSWYLSTVNIINGGISTALFVIAILHA